MKFCCAFLLKCKPNESTVRFSQIGQCFHFVKRRFDGALQRENFFITIPATMLGHMRESFQSQ